MTLTAKQKRNLRKWVEALESGEYKQGQSTLKHGERFCCLGVWCEVGVAGHWDTDEDFIPRRQGVNALIGNIEEIRADLGLTSEEEARYIEMNDKGSRFETIARRIRKDHPEAFA